MSIHVYQHRRGRVLLAAGLGLVSLFLTAIYLYRPQGAWRELEVETQPDVFAQVPRKSDITASRHFKDANACIGPRGKPLDDAGSEDDIKSLSSLPNVSYPVPTIGSYDALVLDKSWMTVDQRWGPYGYGEESTSYNFSRVDWSNTDWGNLQRLCAEQSQLKMEADQRIETDLRTPRFRSPEHIVKDQVVPRKSTGKQAIILRAWSTYEYHPEDLWSIRSIIVEASLATKAEYTVVLLVDVKREDGAAIHTDDAFYQQVLEESVPKEFWNIAVLYHESLQHKWYPGVLEYKPVFQIMQPLQLFAHFYPEYDHYWQFEMDTRFTGHVGKLLQAFHTFGTRQPWKQSRERASWTYMEAVHGSYDEFSKAINDAMKGGTEVWGPLKVNPISPIGPQPPVAAPERDNFEWGVGKDADLLLLTPLADVRRFVDYQDWVYQDWYFGGFDVGIPRFMSVPAQARASYDLLEAIHRNQHYQGLRIASEATLPSFALWHGLKVVGLPIPKFQFPERNLRELNAVENGGMPSDFSDGVANGPGQYHAGAIVWFTRPLTWDWWSSLCNPIIDRWMGHPVWRPQPGDEFPMWNVVVPDEKPDFMAEVDGKMYLPNVMLHPRKSNFYRAPE